MFLEPVSLNVFLGPSYLIFYILLRRNIFPFRRLKEKFPEVKLDDMAKKFKFNIHIHEKQRQSSNSEPILKSATTFEMTANFITKNPNTPTRNLTLIIDFNIILSNDQAQTEKIGFCDTVILIKDKSYLKSYFCTKTESCKYSTRNIKDLRKHEKTCSSETNYKYREKSFGNPKNISIHEL